MPEIIVKIKYEMPAEPYGITPDVVRRAMEAYCGSPDNDFEVEWAERGDPWALYGREGKKTGSLWDALQSEVAKSE
jgi:hypothetical protein